MAKIAKTTLKKNKVGRLTLLDIIMYQRTMFKTVTF